MTAGEQIIVAVLFGGAAFLALALGLLGASRRLPRNPLFGVRTRTSLASDEAWRRIHVRFAPFSYAVAVLWAVTAATPFVTGWNEPLVLAGIGLGLVVLLVGAVRAHRDPG